MGSIKLTPQETQPTQLLQFLLMGNILLSDASRAFVSQGHREIEKEKGWGGNLAVEMRDEGRERTSKNGDMHVQMMKPFMLNFAKTDAELRPQCALLILTNYTRIKNHLLTK